MVTKATMLAKVTYVSMVIKVNITIVTKVNIGTITKTAMVGKVTMAILG
jgi:hypothetical protein